MAQTDRAKLDRLLAKLPSLGDILRGSLLHRTTFHSQGCSKCASGRGHPQWVLNVNYPGGKNRQISLRRDQLPQVRLWLRNHRQVEEDSGGDLRAQPALFARRLLAAARYP